MTDTQSPFRLIQPSQQLYETDPGEIAVSRGVNPENIGGMYGLLINARAKARANQDRYGDLLGSINAQQAALAREKLASDDLKNLQDFRLGLVDKGGVDVSAALSGMQSPGLQSPLTPEQASGALITTDGLRRSLTGAKAFEAQMTGAQRGAEAGYTVVPGQELPANAAAAQRTTLRTGAPMDITLEGMRNAAAARKQAADDGDGETQARAEIDPATGQSKLVFTNKTRPELAIAAQEAYDDHARLLRKHLAQPTRFARPPPFQIPRGSTALANGAPTEGRPLTNQGKTPPGNPLAGSEAARILNGPLPRDNAQPLPAPSVLPSDNRRPSTGTRAGTNVVENPPARTASKSAPPITPDQMNRAQAAVATRGRITGYEWTPDRGRVALYAKGAPLPLGD